MMDHKSTKDTATQNSLTPTQVVFRKANWPSEAERH